MSGMDMLLVNALKAFMPKDVAEKLNITLQGMMNDGTFEQIASLPSDVAEIKRAIGQLHLGMATIAAHLSALETRAPTKNPLYAVADSGPVSPALAKPGPATDGGSGEPASIGADFGHGGSNAAVGGA